jgi:hypothetical protein
MRQSAAENESAREWESPGLKGASVSHTNAALKGPLFREDAHFSFS